MVLGPIYHTLGSTLTNHVLILVSHLSFSPLRSAWQPTSSVDTETGRAGDVDMETVIIREYHEELTLTR